MLQNPDPSSGLSRVDSSLESLAAIPVIHCSSFHFQAFAAAAVINTPLTFRDIPTFLNTILLPG
jgi:hypothetical protein